MEAIILFKQIILVVVIQQSKIKHHQILHKQLQIIQIIKLRFNQETLRLIIKIQPIKIATAQLIKM